MAQQEQRCFVMKSSQFFVLKLFYAACHLLYPAKHSNGRRTQHYFQLPIEMLVSEGQWARCAASGNCCEAIRRLTYAKGPQGLA